MTKQFILDNTMWVIKYISGREVLNGKQIQALERNDGETFWDSVRDIDFLAEQPNKEIQKLVDQYEKIDKFMTWPEFIDKLVEEGAVSE